MTVPMANREVPVYRFRSTAKAVSITLNTVVRCASAVRWSSRPNCPSHWQRMRRPVRAVPRSPLADRPSGWAQASCSRHCATSQL